MAALAVLKSGVDAVLKPVDTFLGFVDIHGVARAILRRAVAFALACCARWLRCARVEVCAVPRSRLCRAPRVRVVQPFEPALVGRLMRRRFEQLAAEMWLQLLSSRLLCVRGRKLRESAPI